MENLKQVEEGDRVLYFDEFGNEHEALLTAVWGERTRRTLELREGETLPPTMTSLDYILEPSVNLVFVSPDKKREDSYGRQIERRSSCVDIILNQGAWGNGWCHLDRADEARDLIEKRKLEFRDN